MRDAAVALEDLEAASEAAGADDASSLGGADLGFGGGLVGGGTNWGVAPVVDDVDVGGMLAVGDAGIVSWKYWDLGAVSETGSDTGDT